MPITAQDIESASAAAIDAFVAHLIPSASGPVNHVVSEVVALVKAAQAKESTFELLGLLASDLPSIIALVQAVETGVNTGPQVVPAPAGEVAV